MLQKEDRFMKKILLHKSFSLQPLQSRGFDTKKFFRVPMGFTFKIGSGRAFLKLKNWASGRVGLSENSSGRADSGRVGAARPPPSVL